MKSVKGFLVAVFVLFVAIAEARAADLQISVTGLRTTKGTVNVAIYDKPEAFPLKVEQAYMHLKLTSVEAAKFIVEQLPPGTYAIAMAHDENNNGKVDKNWYGKPKEGFGFSRNPKVKTKLPKFDECAIEVRSTNLPVGITAQYL